MENDLRDILKEELGRDIQYAEMAKAETIWEMAGKRMPNTFKKQYKAFCESNCIIAGETANQLHSLVYDLLTSCIRKQQEILSLNAKIDIMQKKLDAVKEAWNTIDNLEDGVLHI